jgi:1-acyl-sn-glycerol-3-phosphate acyltransferase
VKLLARSAFPYRAAPVPAAVEPLPEEPTTHADYDTSWARRFPARWARVAIIEGLFRPAVRMIAAPEVAGLDRLAALEGPAIFAANHHSHLDTPLMLTSIPEPWRHRLIVGAAADYFFATRLAGAVSALAFNAIPIERLKVTRRSADLAAELIGDEWSMLIFPEGGRSPDGWGQPFRGGAAYLAIRTGAPVVPVHVEGTGRILRKGRRMPKPAATRVTFGAPMRPEEGEDSRRFSSRVESTVAALADEATTDWFTARRRAHARTTPPLGGPDEPSWRRAWALPTRGRSRHRAPHWPNL